VHRDSTATTTRIDTGVAKIGSNVSLTGSNGFTAHHNESHIDSAESIAGFDDLMPSRTEAKTHRDVCTPHDGSDVTGNNACLTRTNVYATVSNVCITRNNVSRTHRGVYTTRSNFLTSRHNTFNTHNNTFGTHSNFFDRHRNSFETRDIGQ
jgi:hypothetical protein